MILTKSEQKQGKVDQFNVDISDDKIKIDLWNFWFTLITMTSSNKKDWKSESQLTEIGVITGNPVQLHSNQKTMRVKIYFCVISWCFQAVKTWVSHYFLQVFWSFLGCSSLIWPQQTTINAAHLIRKITVGVLAAIRSGRMIMVNRIRQIWKTV